MGETDNDHYADNYDNRCDFSGNLLHGKCAGNRLRIDHLSGWWAGMEEEMQCKTMLLPEVKWKNNLSWIRR